MPCLNSLSTERPHADADTASSFLELTVRRVWAEAMPSAPFDTETCWRDLGLDSLKALGFVVRLERALGRKVGFAGFSATSTTGDLLRVLGSATAASSPAPDEGRRHIFFVPGLLGDEPTQARFRHALRREAHFTTLALPTLDTPGEVLADIPARAARLIETVVTAQPQGELHLAGCSFGALLCQEMARQLEVAGRRVGSLILLDGFLRPQSRLNDRWKVTLATLTEPIVRGARVLEIAGWALRLRPVRESTWARRQSIRLTRAWGVWAVLHWRPQPCAAPALLFASGDFDRLSSVEGWRRICPSVEVVRVPGDHFQLFDPPAMRVICPAVLARLDPDAVAA